VLTERAATVGFDWSDAASVLAKVDEELLEVRDAIAAIDQPQIREEIGDLLFSVVNLARKLQVDAERALDGTNAKFRVRFEDIEAALAATGRSVETATLEEMEALWIAAKRRVG
jgi:ATP diphosphatase